MLGSLLFNAYICDPSYDIDYPNFASFMMTILYISVYQTCYVFGQLKGGTDKMFDWFFKKKILKENADKCNLITSSETPVGN